MTITCPLYRQALTQPHAPAIILPDKTLSYKECHELADSLDIPQGIVRFVPDTSPLSILLFFACLRKNSIAFPISYRLPQPGPTYKPTLKRQKCGSYTFSLDALATHITTSGTTGTPKEIAHTVGNHFYSALGSNEALGLSPDDRWKLSLPLFHVGGIAILFRCFLAGAAVTLTDEATHLSLVPTQLRRMLDSDPRGIKRILLGGDVIPEGLFYEAKNRGFPISPTYGMTEMSSQITTHIEGTHFSLGHPLPYRQIKIVDGEIYVSGKTLAPEKGTWFATGDLGKYTDEGLIHVGRKDRLFISGGENIQPEEIEKVLLDLPGITGAIVSAKDDPEYGKVPIAHVYADQPYTEKELRQALENQLPRFKIPSIKLV